MIPTLQASNMNFHKLDSPAIKEVPAIAQKPLDKDLLEAVIDVLPEMGRLKVVVDQFFWGLHEDSKLPRFSKAFAQVLEGNVSVFQNLESDQKAQILFDKYRELGIAVLSKTEGYQDACKSLLGRTEELDVEEFAATRSFVNEKIIRSCQTRVYQFHSGYIAYVADLVLGLKSGSTHLVAGYQNRDLEASDVLLPLVNEQH